MQTHAWEHCISPKIKTLKMPIQLHFLFAKSQETYIWKISFQQKSSDKTSLDYMEYITTPLEHKALKSFKQSATQHKDWITLYQLSIPP